MSDYYTSVTAAGTAAFANALTTNTPVNFTGITLTDGTTDQKTVAIQSITTDTNNPSWKVVKAVVSPGATSFWLRGLKLLGDAGAVLANGVVPDTYIPSNAIFGGKDVNISFVVNVGTGVQVFFSNTTPINAVTSDYVTGQLENYAKLATVGNAKGVVRVNQTATALTYQHVGKIVCLTHNRQTMFSLPTTGLKDGDRLKLVNFSVYTAIISGNIWTQGRNQGAFDMVGGEAIELYWDATNALFVIVDGSSFLGNLSSFGYTTTANGYNRQPNGIIEQWGSAITNGSGLATLTLPIPFPNGVLEMIPTVPRGATPAYATANTVSNTTVSAYAWNKSGAKYTNISVNFRIKGY